jgi:hypothetical protein
VKPDRPETPAEAKLIGKEFGDFLNLKVREFWDHVNLKVKRSSGVLYLRVQEYRDFFLNVKRTGVGECLGLKAKRCGDF